MLAQERYEAILEMLKRSNIIKITAIVEALGISNETARRDLDVLQEQNLLKRIHGGAMMVDNIASVASVSQTVKSIPEVGRGFEAKQAIGRAAAAMVKDGETIFLDVGSTVYQIAVNLKGFKDLTVITDSLAIANELTASDVNVILLGGKLLHDDQLVCSSFTADNFSRYYVDRSFIGCSGVSLQNGVTDYNEDILDRSLVREHSAQFVLCSESRKFGKSSRVRMCGLETLDTIITDSGIKPEFRSHFDELGIKTIVADKETQK